MFKYSDADLKKLIEGIYSGEISEYDLPVGLYKAIGRYMESGLMKGFGMDLSQAAGRDFELLTELRENVYMFSAAKTFQETKEIQALMIDDKGGLRSIEEFGNVARETFELWNDTWGNTEYQTAVGQAQMASKWNEIEANKKVLPMLRYSAVGDPCEICAPLDGMVAPVDDPIWSDIIPLNHFGCLCTVLQEDETVEATSGNDEIVKEVTGKMDDVFRMNPGKDGYVFSPEHPYFDVAPKDKAYAKRNFDLPLPKQIKETEEE